MGRGSKPAELIGTQSADRIRASGHARRVEQAGHMSAPDRADLSERNPLRGGGRPHMFLLMASTTKTAGPSPPAGLKKFTNCSTSFRPMLLAPCRRF